MALFELKQDYDGPHPEWKRPTFKDCAAADITQAFLNADEHADLWNVDGKDVLAVFEEDILRERSSHWEARAKQNFDTGLYTSFSVLYIRAEDYGPRPKVGKLLTMARPKAKGKRVYSIVSCEDESGVYRMKLERTRQ